MSIHSTSVNINSEKLSKAIRDSGISYGKLSKLVLKRGNNYINSCLQKGTINKTDLDLICEFLGVKPDKFVIEVKEEKIEKPVVKRESGPAVLSKDMDTVLVGIQVMYEEQKKTNELISELLKEIKAQNVKMDRVEKRISTVENAVGQILPKLIMVNDHEEDIVQYLRDIKSSTAILNGRTKDILASVEDKEIGRIAS